MKIKVVIHEAEEGDFWAEVPAIPGCATEGETFEVLTPPARFEAVKEALAAKKVPVQGAELTKIASLQVPVSEKDAGAVIKLVEALEDHDDVQKVYANFIIPDEVLVRLAH